MSVARLDIAGSLPKSAAQESAAMPPLHQEPADSPRTRAAEWFVRLRSDTCSSRDREEFVRWLDADPAHRREYAAIEALWRDLDALPAPVAARRSRPALAWATAAAVLVMLAAGLLAVLTPELETTAKGELRSLTLADGTRARLNSDTVLAVEFSATERRIELRRGEALFEVAPDASRPFRVIAGETTIRDVGTRFDVSRRADQVAVAVTEGRVEIGDVCALGAGLAAAISAAGDCTVAPLDPDRLAWLEGRLVFNDSPLREVVEEYNRYQATPLRLADERAGALRLSGTFRIDHLRDLPTLLPRTLPVTMDAAKDGAWILRSTGAGSE